MALQFPCRNCGENIIVRFLKVGERAQCKKCLADNPVPESTQSIGDETAVLKQSQAEQPHSTHVKIEAAEATFCGRPSNPEDPIAERPIKRRAFSKTPLVLSKLDF